MNFIIYFFGACSTAIGLYIFMNLVDGDRADKEIIAMASAVSGILWMAALPLAIASLALYVFFVLIKFLGDIVLTKINARK